MKLNRRLFADFQLHAGGDPAFKEELIGLMIGNIMELKQVLDHAYNLAAFRVVCHKINTTLYLLADEELMGMVSEIKENGSGGDKINLLSSTCSQVIESLEAELTMSNSKKRSQPSPVNRMRAA